MDSLLESFFALSTTSSNPESNPRFLEVGNGSSILRFTATETSVIFGVISGLSTAVPTAIIAHFKRINRAFSATTEANIANLSLALFVLFAVIAGGGVLVAKDTFWYELAGFFFIRKYKTRLK